MGPDTGSTLWQLVRVAGEARHPNRRKALERLIQSYWQPVYHLFRHSGVSRDDAPDFAQEFFARMLETGTLAKADPERGRFRAYLKTCARNFLINERERAAALKRGGGVTTLSLDFESAERMFEPAGGGSPEKAFDRQWALGLLQTAIAQLEAEHAGPLFDAVRAAFRIDGPPEVPTHARIARDLNISEQDVGNFLFRSRRRLREILRERVTATVDSPADADDEIRALFEAIR